MSKRPKKIERSRLSAMGHPINHLVTGALTPSTKLSLEARQCRTETCTRGLSRRWLCCDFSLDKGVPHR
jgi:hypothetical protein